MPTRRRFFGLAAASAAVALPLKSQPPAARPAMQLGLIVSAGTDPEAAIRKVHSFGIPTCQVGIGAFDPGMPARLRAALDASAAVALPLKSQTPAARPAMQLGLIVSAGTDPEAAIRKVHSFGIPTCQVGMPKLWT